MGGILQTDMPVSAFRRLAMHPHILTKIHQEIGDPAFQPYHDDAVHGIFLADAAQVQAHAFTRQKNPAFATLEFAPADQFPTRSHR